MASTAAAHVARRTASLSAPTRTSARSFSSALLGSAEEFPGVPSLRPAPARASAVSVATIPELGLTVATESSARASTVLLHLPAGGSASEASGEAGCSHVSKFLSFKSNARKSSLGTLRMMEDLGITPIARAGRTSAIIGYSATPDVAADPDMLDTLASPCTFEAWDVRDAVKTAMIEREQAYSDPHLILSDKIHTAAFGEASSLGRSFYVDAVPSTESLAAFRARAYGSSGAVLSATGVADHEAFVAAAEAAFGAVPAGGTGASPAATMVGGEQRVPAATAYAHLAMALQAPSDPVVAAVLQKCIGLSGASGFGSSELIGAYGYANGEDAASLVASLVTALQAAAGAPIEAAKAAAKGDALLDGGLADSVVAGVAVDGAYDFAAVAASYDAVTVETIKTAAEEALAGPLAVAAVGDVSSVAHHYDIAKALSS